VIRGLRWASKRSSTGTTDPTARMPDRHDSPTPVAVLRFELGRRFDAEQVVATVPTGIVRTPLAA
jgi:hypothetical protein